MIYIETNSKDVYFNFAVEEYFLTQKRIEDTIFLLWSTTPTVMVGKYQNTKSEFNEKYVSEHNINVVRRQSGGGTIYTDEGGWQFSYIIPREKEIEFKEAAKDVVSALNKMGVKAEFNQRNDITVEGRKISGNARYVSANYILHHGSLLYDSDFSEMEKVLTPNAEKLSAKGIKSVKQRVANISEFKIFDDFKQTLLSYILPKCKVMELENIEQINKIAERFKSWEFVYKQNPAYEIKVSKRFGGGLVNCSYFVNHGVFENFEIGGDFFCNGDLDSFLIGCSVKSTEIEKELKRRTYLGESFFESITNEEFINIIK